MTGSPSAAQLVTSLMHAGATHLVGIPDNMSAALYREAGRSALTIIPVTREGEAFGLAAGLWMGGAHPVVMIQNTGLLESGDALRGTILRMGIPLLILITFRGYASLPAVVPDDSEVLLRPDVDSVAVLTRPTLDAWRVPVSEINDAGDETLIDAIWPELRDGKRPHAILLTRGLV